MDAQSKENKCMNCGATITSVNNQYTCEFCGTVYSVPSVGGNTYDNPKQRSGIAESTFQPGHNDAADFMIKAEYRSAVKSIRWGIGLMIFALLGLIGFATDEKKDAEPSSYAVIVLIIAIALFLLMRGYSRKKKLLGK
jgi:hypothetical protein